MKRPILTAVLLLLLPFHVYSNHALKKSITQKDDNTEISSARRGVYGDVNDGRVEAITVDDLGNVHATDWSNDASGHEEYAATKYYSVPDVITVTNLNDAGNGSLRWAIDAANNHIGPDSIFFAVSGTILLTTPSLAIADDQTYIVGSTAPGGARSVVLEAIWTIQGPIIFSDHNEIRDIT
ncbi:MAG: hypothetical protein JSV44_03920, partial [Candidatus Zixiibacteriota bacterium]